ncbi:phosphoethanolamine transferase [Stenotrophomonas sp. Betaine-02u-21]|uniref:phosphoethanolamine transferase n=1 Tax=unclassified Stenotrophomonas TaxID=196198 RepID=UPI000C329EF7|nr:MULTISPECIES: phosphoethanolamine--lipid A transferase [unclassified Stenotrophomonas]PKH70965.1 phosphoethanolamine transferase [Stenotrophomonas sp. Betaine-02u-21]PKH73662.1 phosphoethanolamine transferase [Stenotrophomonas sp. Betaine-02u-23]PKH95669.1 phosphoethanolamine transferase [Stenotrophomonas sp. Bg11-02]
MSATVARTLRLPAVAWLQGRPRLSTEALIALASLFFAIAGNGLFWNSAMATHPGSLRYALSLLLLLLGTHAFLLGLLVWRWNAKVVVSTLLMLTMLASHYMGRYHIYLDADMLRNVLATDRRESSELLTASLAGPLLLGLVPTLAVWRLQLTDRRWTGALSWRAGFLLLAAGVAVGGALLSFQEISALMRSQREVRYLATPANVLLGLPRALRGDNPVQRAPKLPIGVDAQAMHHASGSRPRLLLVVLGETARAQNWGLNGGSRQTTPELAQKPVINFPDMHSCGTSTEVSVPCMFSPWGRGDYDEKKIRAHQSLLHVLDHAGIDVLWRDNQSGCKGVCEGLPLQSLADATTPGLCANGRCLDEILLQDLPAQARAKPGDRVIVLHQLGNHGPAYFERYPPRFRRFTPTCDTVDLGRCTRDQIANSYDNALLYTDHVLAQAIGTLQGMEDYDTAMIYVSDHGESLGEKGLFLHGIPYAIAPEEQTHVPMTMWFSPSFARNRGLDLECVRQRAGRYTDHDALFSSVLGLMQVRTALYAPQRDLFAACEG